MADFQEQIVDVGELEPVRTSRTDLVKRVVDQLRERILGGTFEQGGSLPAESTLGVHFGVSRPVVREAMRVLSAQGLIEVCQGKRARIKPADPQASVEALSVFFNRSKASPLDLVEVRRVLEVELAALAAQRATEEDLKALEKTSEALKAAKAFDKLEDAVEADVAFHQRLAQATGNRALILVMQTLGSLLLESVQKTASRCPADVHDAIIEAVRTLSLRR
jgi:GntR family transcriptional repressor for pyruvate dehydrogenase complex